MKAHQWEMLTHTTVALTSSYRLLALHAAARVCDV